MTKIIESTSETRIGGFFTLECNGYRIDIQHDASLSEMESQLESIPGLGNISVTTYSVKELVEGVTVSAVHGLDTVAPSISLSAIGFDVGDWIRIGDETSSQVFSIINLQKHSPYTVTLSSIFSLKSNDSLQIFEEGLRGDRRGYQYVIEYDSSLGDVPAPEIVSHSLTGSNAEVKVISCNDNEFQKLIIYESLEGSFSLFYGNEVAEGLPSNLGPDHLKDVIEDSFTLLSMVTITTETTDMEGAQSFLIRLDQFDGPAQPFYAEGNFHFPTGHKVHVSVEPNVCPYASADSTGHRVQSQVGRKGCIFAIQIEGSSTNLRGESKYIANGEYLISYVSPREGDYKLNIKLVSSGGLYAEYFNNRWLFGSPTNSRIDSLIDFSWDSDDFITLTGKDYVSARWTGFIEPSFSEHYTFTVHVNDGVRLWIGNILILDAYENEVNTGSFNTFVGSTSYPLEANVLSSVKLEFRENKEEALLKLLWESPSQPQEVIPSFRLYNHGEHIKESPFIINPVGVEPKAPSSCHLSVIDWDSLVLNWSKPSDDGGSDLLKFRVEYWDATDGTS